VIEEIFSLVIVEVYLKTGRLTKLMHCLLAILCLW